jgi:hypothetical protein
MVISVHEVARCPKVNISYNILIFGNLRYPATFNAGGDGYHKFYFICTIQSNQYMHFEVTFRRVLHRIRDIAGFMDMCLVQRSDLRTSNTSIPCKVTLSVLRVQLLISEDIKIPCGLFCQLKSGHSYAFGGLEVFEL